MQSRLFKNPKFPSLFLNYTIGNIHSPRPAFKNPSVESMDELCPIFEIILLDLEIQSFIYV